MLEEIDPDKVVLTQAAIELVTFRTFVQIIGCQQFGIHEISSQRMIIGDAVEPFALAVVVSTAITNACHIETMLVEQSNRQCTGHGCVIVSVAVIDHLICLAYRVS